MISKTFLFPQYDKVFNYYFNTLLKDATNNKVNCDSQEKEQVLKLTEKEWDELISQFSEIALNLFGNNFVDYLKNDFSKDMKIFRDLILENIDKHKLSKKNEISPKNTPITETYYVYGNEQQERDEEKKKEPCKEKPAKREEHIQKQYAVHKLV